MNKSTVTIVKYIQHTKLEIKFECPNDMQIPDLINTVNRQYPGYVIVSIELKHPPIAADSRSRVYSFIVLTDGKRFLSEVKNNLNHLIGGGSEAGETARQAAFRELNEEISIDHRFRWYPEMVFLDSRVTYYNGTRYLENIFMVEVSPAELDNITSKEGRQLATIPNDKDYIDNLGIGTECDESYVYGVMMAHNYLL